ncbi:MAG: hypothetical protein ABIS23_04835 [Sphingomicrobium sp.]
MNLRTLLVAAIGLSMVVSGCSSRPRAYAPTLAAPPVDKSAFDLAYATCNQLLVDGKLDHNGRLASAAGGAAAGGAGVAVGSATAAAVAGYGGLAVVAATVVLLPFAIVGGAVGMAKIKRTKKEKAIKTAIAGCLKERGYEIIGWTRMIKSDIARADAAKVETPAAAPLESN